MARHGSTDDSLQNRLFSQLLRWYPEDYRWQYGPGMRQTFADRLREAQQQNETLGLAIFLVREFLSLAGGGIAHRTSDLAQDIRFTLRTLSREKSFTLTAVATLALGIGANTVIFSIVNGVLLHPLPYHDPDRLVRLHEVAPQGWGMGFSPPNLSSYQEQATLFEGMAAFRGTSLTLLTDDQAEKVPAMRVSAGFFGLLGISMSMGRTIVPEEDLDSAAPVVVLGDSIWRRLYGGKRNILGSTITLDGLTHTVVGIAPPELRFGSRPIDLWVPFAFDERDIEGRGRHFLEVIARLKPDIDVVAARAELESIAADLGQLHPETNTGWGILVLSLMDETVLGVRQPLLILFTAVVLVLLIACSNVANLLLARTQHRVAEMGTRAALGASRERLIRQTLTENIVLAAMGGVAALVLAYGGVKLIVSIAGRQLPRASEVSIDFSVLIFTFAVALGAGLFIGLAPAFSGTRLDLMSVVKNPRSERVSRRRPSLRSLLVVIEIALSLILLVGAGLLIRSFWQLTHVESGLKPEGLLTASV
ncbi:MAG: FtsX-like permease family protein, partial [bacterium]|nr:FtsX-like permease family protein [bacterium]